MEEEGDAVGASVAGGCIVGAEDEVEVGIVGEAGACVLAAISAVKGVE